MARNTALRTFKNVIDILCEVESIALCAHLEVSESLVDQDGHRFFVYEVGRGNLFLQWSYCISTASQQAEHPDDVSRQIEVIDHEACVRFYRAISDDDQNVMIDLSYNQESDRWVMNPEDPMVSIADEMKACGLSQASSDLRNCLEQSVSSSGDIHPQSFELIVAKIAELLQGESSQQTVSVMN